MAARNLDDPDERAHYWMGALFGFIAPASWPRLPAEDPLDPMELASPAGGARLSIVALPATGGRSPLELLRGTLQAPPHEERSFIHRSGCPAAEATAPVPGGLVERSIFIAGPDVGVLFTLRTSAPGQAKHGRTFSAIVDSVAFGKRPTRPDPAVAERVRVAFGKKWPSLRFDVRGPTTIEAVDPRPPHRVWRFDLTTLSQAVAADPGAEAELVRAYVDGVGLDVKIVPRATTVGRPAPLRRAGSESGRVPAGVS